MNFALDATYSAGRNLSGVGVYCREILQGLAASHPEARFLWCYRPHRLRSALSASRPTNVRSRPLFDNFCLAAPDLFHGLNQRMPAWRARRSVCTFHDLFVLTSDYSSPDFRARFSDQARLAAQRADLLICVSTFTAGQVHELLGVERSRLRVIPHGTHLPPPAPPIAREPIILHVGAVQLRKNLVRLVGAFEQAAPAPWRLVLVGSDGYGAAGIHERIARSPARTRIETTGWIDEPALRSLFRRASLFAFPSLDEGFGIPVLEAMAYGLPVLSSNRSALPEACGDAALLVDPFDQDAIAHGLSLLLDREDLRLRLAHLGRQRAEESNWRRAVARTWDVYSELFA